MLVLVLDHVTLKLTQESNPSLYPAARDLPVSPCVTMWVLGYLLCTVSSIDLTRQRHSLLGLVAQVQRCLPCLLYLEIALWLT